MIDLRDKPIAFAPCRMGANSLVAITTDHGESETSPHERAIAFLDAILIFKLENVHLPRALEFGPGVSQSNCDGRQAAEFIEDAAPRAKTTDAVFAAHVVLARLHTYLIEEMIAGSLSIGS